LLEFLNHRPDLKKDLMDVKEVHLNVRSVPTYNAIYATIPIMMNHKTPMVTKRQNEIRRLSAEAADWLGSSKYQTFPDHTTASHAKMYAPTPR
jgi:hypothetical protein